MEFYFFVVQVVMKDRKLTCKLSKSASKCYIFKDADHDSSLDSHKIYDIARSPIPLLL